MDISYPSTPLCNNRRKLTCAIALTVAFAGQAQAAPDGGTIVGGDGSISQTGSETTIIQESDRLAIDSDSFNISADERVQFVQPDSSSLALNRILGNDTSQIFGGLDANGHVVLVNPNGVIFGESATVNVGGLVASGLNSISSEDFMNGDLAVHASGTGGGVVINSGLLHAASGGNVALLGVRVTNETLQDKLGMEPEVLNSGEIRASSGRALLTVSAGQDVFSPAVNSGDLAGDTDVLVHDDGAEGSSPAGSCLRGTELVLAGENDTVCATNLIKGNISAGAKRAMVIEGELDAPSRWAKAPCGWLAKAGPTRSILMPIHLGRLP